MSTVQRIDLTMLRAGKRKRPLLTQVVQDEVRGAIVAAGFDDPSVVRPRRDLLIEYLHAINDRYRQLWVPHLSALAAFMRLSLAEVFEVASFYHHFRVVGQLEDDVAPTAATTTVRVCASPSCAMRGSLHLHKDLVEAVTPGVSVVAVPCIGRCEQAPACAIGENEMGHATASKIAAAIADVSVNAAIPSDAIGLERYLSQGGYALLRSCTDGARDVTQVISAIEDSGLRGLGGAGFPAGRKWRAVRAQTAPRLMAVNIDEGEPGTFKDRYYLERNPHRFIEGMLIAAWAVGIDAIYIYLRDEYHACRKLLQRELALLRAAPPIANMPHIELRRGAGAYICGEESAMIESIEGKRGIPRLRPPYVAEVGLFGRPTLEHNFETLYWIPEILGKGAQWFASHGVNGRSGLRSFSVSGRVNNPGVKLAPAGISLRALVNDYCDGMESGHTLYAYLPGGASGGILPASLADAPLDFDTLQAYGCFIGSAAIVVLSQADRVVDVARNLMKFFEDESCGQCTPCRAGTAKAGELIAASVWNRELLEELSQVMCDASICGLGQAAPNPIDSVFKYFAHELTDQPVAP